MHSKRWIIRMCVCLNWNRSHVYVNHGFRLIRNEIHYTMNCNCFCISLNLFRTFYSVRQCRLSDCRWTLKMEFEKLEEKNRIRNVCSDKMFEFQICTPQMNYTLTSIPIKIELTSICFVLFIQQMPNHRISFNKNVEMRTVSCVAYFIINFSFVVLIH